MIGLNGGLIGAARNTGNTQSVPGVWTLREQLKAKRAFLWPITIIPGSEDPYFYSNSLLLYGDGADASTAIVDSSSNAHAVTVYGDAQISTNQSKFGGSSLYFDGSGDYLGLPSSSQFATGTSDFTIECWYYPVSKVTAYPRIFQVGTAAWGTSDNWSFLDRHNSAPTKFAWACVNLGGNSLLLTSTTTVTDNVWYHVAVTRSGSTFRMFINGIQESTYTNSGAVTTSASTGAWVASAAGANDSTGHAHIDDLRFTKGVARYTANFTPPTGPFSAQTPVEPHFFNNSLLLFGDGTNGSTAILDSSINDRAITANGNAQISTTESKFGGSSLYFDGTGDFLSTPGNIDFSFDGDFTIELWIKTSAFSINTFYRRVVSTGPDIGNALQLLFFNGSGASSNISVRSSIQLINGTIPAATGDWVHVALTRSGTAMKLFVNGTQSGSTATVSTAFTAGSTYGCTVGRYQGGNGHFDGYMDDLRITKGVARYTANFTPPTESFSSPSTNFDQYFFKNSLLLRGAGTNGSTEILDSSSNAHVVTANGNAQISTTESKFGGSSLYFDGSGDYLSVADNNDFELGSGNFTLEAWVYLTGYSANYSGNYIAVILAKDSGSTGRSFTFAISGTASSWTSVSVTLFASTSPLVLVGNTGSFNFSLNTWYHVAAVRSGTSVRLYVNGNDVGGGTNSTNTASTTTSLIIGAEDPFYQAQGFAYYFPGYIDDLRITKGVARYTANFTPPGAL